MAITLRQCVLAFAGPCSESYSRPGNWSVDAGLSYSGERWANTANTFKTPAVTTLNLGARHRLELAGRPAEFRVLASNLTDVDGYRAMPSGVLTPIAPRTVRAMLRVTFRPQQP